MKRIVHRLLITLGFSGGLIALVAAAAHAGESLNHSEPVAEDRDR